MVKLYWQTEQLLHHLGVVSSVAVTYIYALLPIHGYVKHRAETQRTAPNERERETERARARERERARARKRERDREREREREKEIHICIDIYTLQHKCMHIHIYTYNIYIHTHTVIPMVATTTKLGFEPQTRIDSWTN
jgi:hypothetical protein